MTCRPSIEIFETPSGLSAIIDGGAPIALRAGGEGRFLKNAFLALRASGGQRPASLVAHWTHHQSVPEGACHWCKLEGRILASQGRKAPGALRPSPGVSGSVLIRHIPLGETRASIEGRAKHEATLARKRAELISKGSSDELGF